MDSSASALQQIWDDFNSFWNSSAGAFELAIALFIMVMSVFGAAFV